MDERIERARISYERAVFDGDSGGLPIADRELDAVEADLALARGRLLHARFLDGRKAEEPNELALFERAVQLYHRVADARGEAEALFWVGCFHQVVRGDSDTAAEPLHRSLTLATEVGDQLTASYALRHLGLTEHAAGRMDAAFELFEASTRLRREVGFMPGVAANLVGLAYISAARKEQAQALRFLDEADAIVTEWGARGIGRHIADARASIGDAAH